MLYKLLCFDIVSTFFQLFHSLVSIDHLKHVTAKIQVSHETRVINDYWKTLTFYNCLAKSCYINNYILKYSIYVFPNFSFDGFHRSPQACYSQNTSFQWNYSNQRLLENSDFFKLLSKKLQYKQLCFKILYLLFSKFFIWRLSQITSSMLHSEYKFPMGLK